jgi:hypothetical protein
VIARSSAGRALGYAGYFDDARVLERDLTMRSRPGWIVSLALVAALLTGEAGAADRCGDVDLSKLTTRIYVTPTGTDSDSCGASPSIPCQSIQRGIDRCGHQGCGVLVRYGLYSLREPIRLRDGVSVYGRCVFDSDSDRKYRSVIEAPQDGKPGIIADKIVHRTVLDGVFVRGSDVTSPGGASIAMTVSNSPISLGDLGLTIAHSILSSGKGADGASGGTGVTGGEGGWGSDAAGYIGGAGGAACDGGTAGKGGKGADANRVKVSVEDCFFYCKCEDANESGGETGSPSGAANGGPGRGRGHEGCACDGSHTFQDAEDGASADPGQPGACASTGGVPNANIWGGFDGTNWVSMRGGQGSPGAVGAGGGGGGSGGYAVSMRNGIHPVSGRSGGGGGGGGCGGEGGIGGQQGGASIPLVLFESSVQTGDLVLVSGPGGRGGSGGTGGTGGAGGQGHLGEIGRKVTVYGTACVNQAPGNGGIGGHGGQGGAGGGGGGGDGGPSVGIALVGNAKVDSNSAGIYASQPGTGGTFGQGGRNASDQCKGADGNPGIPGGGKGDWKRAW